MWVGGLGLRSLPPAAVSATLTAETAGRTVRSPPLLPGPLRVDGDWQRLPTIPIDETPASCTLSVATNSVYEAGAPLGFRTVQIPDVSLVRALRDGVGVRPVAAASLQLATLKHLTPSLPPVQVKRMRLEGPLGLRIELAWFPDGGYAAGEGMHLWRD